MDICPYDRSDLCIKYFRQINQNPDAPPSKVWIRLLDGRVDQLVTADIKQADIERHRGDRFSHFPVIFVLFRLFGYFCAFSEQIFASEQTDTFSAGRVNGLHLFLEIDIGIKGDP